jgi:4-hydroxybenzoate polyprenyltransferase
VVIFAPELQTGNPHLMKHYLKLVRWSNLLFLALIFFLPRFFLIVSEDLPHALPGWAYVLLTLSVVLVAASGYVINDIYDQDVDSVNKPERRTVGIHISERTAIRLFTGLAIAGAGIGVYLAYYVDMPNLAFIHPIGVAILWLYAMDFKKRPLIGNLLIAILSGMTLLLIVAFDLVPKLGTFGNKEEMLALKSIIYIIVLYGAFAFFTTWIREIIKDIEDFDGDNRMGFKTLPVVMGIPNTKILLSVLLTLLSLGICWYLYNAWSADILSFIYVFAAVLGPVLIVFYLLWTAKVKADYSLLANMMKIIMVMGILSIMVFTLSMRLGGTLN